MFEINMNKLISDIVVLARMITKGTSYEIIANYYGHVDSLEVRLYSPGVEEPTVRQDVSFDEEYRSKKVIIKDLTELKNKLVEILVTGELDISQMHKEKYGSTETYFFLKRH
ncbi:hypothetical protein [Paenibacillus elgii]|uniref:hypothetical protein n=1 Tax=Paenibacillus elgii TaxID=189691 RepID=UPI0013D4A466|nr:hypothetical protein [Paenibacillus elgii]